MLHDLSFMIVIFCKLIDCISQTKRIMIFFEHLRVIQTQLGAKHIE